MKPKMYNVIVRKKGRAYQVYVGGRLYNMESLAKRCNISMTTARIIIHRPDVKYKINDFIVKAENGISSKEQTYYHKHCPMWMSIVMELSGCMQTSGTKRLERWCLDGDYDKLFKPVVKYKTKGTMEPVTTTKKQEPDKTMSKRKSIADVAPIGTWEAQHL